MAEKRETETKSTKDTKEAAAPASPEGVPYQTGAYAGVGDDENAGPFDDGEGKNSGLLKANQAEDS